MRRMFTLFLLTSTLLVLLFGCNAPFSNFDEDITLSKLGKATIVVDWEKGVNQRSISVSEQVVNAVCVIIDNKIGDPNYSFTFKKNGWNLWTPALDEGVHKIMAIDEGESATNSSNVAEFRIRSGSNIKIEIQPGGGVFIENK